MKKIVLFLISLFLLASCQPPKSEVYSTENKIEVVASIVPVASIVNYIWGDYVNVNSLIPAWVSPHNFELKPQDMMNIENSDLIVYLNLDHIDGFLNKNIQNKSILKLAEWIDLLKTSSHSHEHEEEVWHWDDELEIDAHIWTSWKNAIEIATKIQKLLTEVSPSNWVYFQKNLEYFKSEIVELQLEYEREVNKKTQKEFIVFHDAYNYLFQELNIDNNKKLVFKSNVLNEPNSLELKELIDEIKHHWVNTIFKEPQFNDENLAKFASEYKLNVFDLDPLWTDISSRGFIQNYKNNLLNLKNIYE